MSIRNSLQCLAAIPLLLFLLDITRIRPQAQPAPATASFSIDARALVTPVPVPDFDREVLVPLRAKQAEAERQWHEAKRIADEKAAQEAREAAERAARAGAEQVAAMAATTRQAASQSPTPATGGSHTDWMAAAGILPSDYGYVDFIVSHESGWRHWATNSEGSGAQGLCQALPGSKMASAGPDYLTNPVTQLRWCASYAVSRYGSWAAAYVAWQRQNWW